jgi:uncharacterized SAM-binding protein YcdF (DUF218 family)
VFLTGLAAAAFLLFAIGVARDARLIGNAVLLGLALALGALAVVRHLEEDPARPDRLLLELILLVIVAGPFLVGGFLVANGITMARKERLSPANLLSLAAGFAVFAVLGLTIAAERLGSLKFTLLTGVTDLLFGYVSFLLVSYVIYGFVYARLTGAGLTADGGPADFVVVLGAGLKRDGTVTPLLAKRLDRALEVAARPAAGPAARGPVLVVSGGKGGDERVAEAEAMSAYLTDHGVPPGAILLEDRSRNTEENLRFSQSIMESARPGGRCVIVTSNFHVLRTAMLARRLGVRGHVAGAPVALYYWPSATLREFAAVFLTYRLLNLAVCALIVVLPLAYVALRLLVTRA